MELRPGYMQTEVGVIPEDWEVKRVGNLADIVSGGTPMTTNPIYWNGSIKWCTPTDVTHCSGKYQNETERTISEVGLNSSGARLLPAGALLLCSRATIGAVKVAGVEICTNQGFKSLVCRPVVNNEFLYYKLLTMKQRMVERSFGSTFLEISKANVAALELSVPALPEQRAIAEALSDVDALLDALTRLIAKKGDLKQAAMQQLLTGKTRLPGFSGEWEVKQLRDICEIGIGRTPPRLDQSMWGLGHAWLSIADLKSKTVSESKEQITERAAASMTIVPKGTLLMSFKLSIGRLCFAGCGLFTNEAICSFNRLLANAEFLYYALGRTDFSIYGKQAVKGYTLNTESLNRIGVSLPAPEEQTAIATVLSDMDAEIAALERRREKTRAIKQGMMQQLLTGRTRLV